MDVRRPSLTSPKSALKKRPVEQNEWIQPSTPQMAAELIWQQNMSDILLSGMGKKTRSKTANVLSAMPSVKNIAKLENCSDAYKQALLDLTNGSDGNQIELSEQSDAKDSK